MGSRPALRIEARADDAARFVEQEVAPARRAADSPPVDADHVARRIRLRAELGHDHPIELDAALLDEGVGQASRGHA